MELWGDDSPFSIENPDQTSIRWLMTAKECIATVGWRQWAYAFSLEIFGGGLRKMWVQSYFFKREVGWLKIVVSRF